MECIDTNSSTFRQILDLQPEEMRELIETVGYACSLNKHINISQDEKIAMGIVMLRNTRLLLEDAGCDIHMKIFHKNWDTYVQYDTTPDGKD